MYYYSSRRLFNLFPLSWTALFSVNLLSTVFFPRYTSMPMSLSCLLFLSQCVWNCLIFARGLGKHGSRENVWDLTSSCSPVLANPNTTSEEETLHMWLHERKRRTSGEKTTYEGKYHISPSHPAQFLWTKTSLLRKEMAVMQMSPDLLITNRKLDKYLNKQFIITMSYVIIFSSEQSIVFRGTTD